MSERRCISATFADVRAGLSERAARADRRRQDLADAADGGARRADAGRIVVDGRDVTGSPCARTSPWCTSNSSTTPLTVFENIASPLRVARLPKAEIEARVREAARAAAAEPYLDRKPLELRAASSSAPRSPAPWSSAPLVLLDEPLANLDYKLREELREELPSCSPRAAASSSMRRPSRPRRCCSAAASPRCREGRVTQFGMAGEVFRRPADLATARVFSDPPLNEAPARIEAGRLVAWRPARRCRCRLAGLPDGRLHHRHPRRTSSSLEPLRGAVPLPAVVRVSEVTGSESYVHLDVGAPFVGWRPACGGRNRARRRRLARPAPALPGLRRGWAARGAPCGPAGVRPPDGADRLRAAGARLQATRQPGDYALQPMDHGLGGCRRLCAARALRLRQDDVAEHRLRPAAAERGAGAVRRAGRDALPTERRNVAQVFQFPVVYDTMTVRENLAFPLRTAGASAREANQRVEDVAGLLGLGASAGPPRPATSAPTRSRRSPSAAGWCGATSPPSCSTSR